MSEEPTGTVAPGDNLVIACPLCGERFLEPLPTNTWNGCDPDAGCGKKFLVKSKNG